MGSIPWCLPDWDDTDYSPVAGSYAAVRRADPVIAAQLHDALGAARTVINVGAGTGSYEPSDRYVLAVEPSAEMRAKRSGSLAPALAGRADALPFDDDAFEAALAVLTVHHWPDLHAGLRELRRVTRGPVVIMTADPGALDRLWIAHYAPEFHEVESRRYPPLEDLVATLGTDTEIRPVRIPLNCSDGFADAFYGRPEAMLDPSVRQAQSAWSFVTDDAQARFVQTLSADLDSGVWDARHGHLRSQPEFEGSMRILIAEAA
jgi:SAM-dependent methyltransferase